MKKRFWISLFLLLVLSTYKIQADFNLIPDLSIKKIFIENNDIIDDKTVFDCCISFITFKHLQVSN